MGNTLNPQPKFENIVISEKNQNETSIYAVFADDVVNELGVEEYFKKIFPALDQGEIDLKILSLKEKIIQAKIEGSTNDDVREDMKRIIKGINLADSAKNN